MLICLRPELKDDAVLVLVLQQINTVDGKLRCGWGFLCGSLLRYLQNRHTLQCPIKVSSRER